MNTAFNTTMTKGPKPIIEGNYNVTGDTTVIPILEHEE